MSDRLPYEEMMDQQWNDLPLPDEQQSWEKMSRLLDEEEKRRRFLPPFFLTGCLGWGLFFAGLLLVFWILAKPQRWWQVSENKTATEQQIPSLSRTGTDHLKQDSTFKEKMSGSPRAGSNGPAERDRVERKSSVPSVPDKSTVAPAQTPVNGQKQLRTAGRMGVTVSGSSTGTPASKRIAARKPAEAGKQNGQKEQVAIQTVPPDRQQDLPDTTGNRDGSGAPVPAASGTPADTVKAVPQPDTAQSSKTETEKKNRKFAFSAGIGWQQQIPLGGQNLTPYNYYGRKSSLADYIPFVYLRWHRPGKWFAEGSFRYGAPQSVKEVTYNNTSVTVVDTLGGQSVVTTTTTSSRLKKTFYHQVPLSFNYAITPHWSAGGGFLYSRFHGAVSEVEVHRSTNQVDSLLSKKIVQVPANSDSFFTRSQIHLLFQTEYEWRRLGFGFRYSRGLQPFLTYTDAFGRLKEERNQSLQFFLRFRIWSSKK